MNTILEMRNICKSFSENVVLNRVNFTLYEGETRALVGVNGAGKSTLIKILNGIYHADEGEIFLDGKRVVIRTPQDAEKLGVRFVHQELNICPDLSVAENIFIGNLKKNRMGLYDKKSTIQAAQKLIDQLQINIHATDIMRNLRAAEKQIIEILKAMTLNSRILVLDEPTSSLSENERRLFFSLLQNLKKKGVSFIFISHFLEDVLEFSDHVTVIKDSANNGDFVTKETTKEELIFAMMGKSIAQRKKGRLDFDAKVQPTLKLENLCSEGKFENINITVPRGMILGVCGLLGAGKSEIARSIFGLDRFDSGRIILNGEEIKRPNPADMIKKGVAMVTEDRKTEGFVPFLSISENITLSIMDQLCNKLGIVHEKEREKRSHKLADDMMVKRSSDKQNVVSLSGGNQQKVIISRCVASQPSLFILDEPTRGVDVYAKVEIYNVLQAMAERGVSIMIFSSELDELLSVCREIVILRRGEMVGIVDADDLDKETLLGMIS